MWISVIPLIRICFSAKDVVTPAGIHQNHGNNQQPADQHKPLIFWRRCRLPERNRWRNNIRAQADAHAAEPEEHLAKREYKWPVAGLTAICTEQNPPAEHHQEWHRSKLESIWQAEPLMRYLQVC